MASAPKGNALVSQSGGPTGVINASLVGVIEEACRSSYIENLYGAVHAVSGIVKNQLIDLKRLSMQTVGDVEQSPSAALGSSRDKPDAAYCERILKVFKERQIRYFFYIGGNDSANTCHIINTMATDTGYDLSAFHIPKTIDNDLLVTDHCPGYGTAALFVASALMGDDMDNRALPGIKIDCIMGRNAGFLAASSALARQRDDDGPHLVYLPERPITMDKMMADIDAVYKKLGRCVVAVSEGITDADKVCWAEKIISTKETDSHGNVQLSGSGALADFIAAQVKSKLGVKRVRADTFGYLQRSFAGLQSHIDAEEARRCGLVAVRFAATDQNGSVAIRRVADGDKYAVEYFRTDLKNVAEKTKCMPDQFIAPAGNDVTKAFLDYARPLAGQLPRTCWLGSEPRV
jgi:ATP-dependent phosphofructokinase / diphosphate-dependent phosphofructokinase